MNIGYLLIGLFISGAAVANCPDHRTVTYTCQTFNGQYQQCTWNPFNGWYQGSSNHGDYPIPPGSQTTRFLRAFWTPNVHMTPDKISYGVTICQYSFQGQVIVLYQKDRNVNIADPRRKNKKIWSIGEWQGVKGYSCYLNERECDFDYGEKG